MLLTIRETPGAAGGPHHATFHTSDPSGPDLDIPFLVTQAVKQEQGLEQAVKEIRMPWKHSP